MQTANPSKQKWFVTVCVALAIGTFILFLPVVRNDFINLDDGVYIYQNPHVASGLSWQNIRWSFEHVYAGYWAPLTWISHMTDCSLFGLNPAGHHLVNVLIHAINAVLLFILLNYMTGAMWRSAFVAAAFAWHPLRVESVAWACERKDVLSGLFWMLALLYYTRYAKGKGGFQLVMLLPLPPSPLAPKPGEGGSSSSSSKMESLLPSKLRDHQFLPEIIHVSLPPFEPPKAASSPAAPRPGEGWSSSNSSPFQFLASPYYWCALFCLACGLMSKPMVVTLPFVLILLDFWPLGRFYGTDGTNRTDEAMIRIGRLLAEKIPFFALALAECVATYRDCGAGASTSTEPLTFRLIHSFWGYLEYISKTFVPVNLAVLYPFPAHEPVALGLVGAVLVLICTVAFIVQFRRRPYLLVGWFWFLGTLVPVIGIVQSGYQSMADRFTYLPCIGFFIVIAWGFADLVRLPGGRTFLATTVVAALGTCIILTSIQIGYWRNNITLFRHALAVTTDNYVACTCLGQALDNADDDKDALLYCKEAVRLNPDYAAGQFFFGQALAKSGDPADALTHLNLATQLEPDNADFKYNLGKFLLEHGKTDEAISHFTTVLDIDPDFAEAHNALGKAFLKQGSLPKAADQLSRAVALKPSDAQFHYDFGTVLLDESQPAQAIAEFSKAVWIQPNFALAHENLAVALVQEGKMDDAIVHFARVVELQPDDSEARFNLGFAYLNGHQAAKAAGQFRAELRLAPNETKAHYRLAQALRDGNDFSQAIAEYRKTLELAPNFADAKKEMDEILAGHRGLR